MEFRQAGAAAALSKTSNEFGFALGIATLGSLGNAVYRSQIANTMPSRVPAAAAHAARESLASATDATQHQPDVLAAALLTTARAAFTSGLHLVAAIRAITLIGVGILVVTQRWHVRLSAEAQADETSGIPTDALSADHEPIEPSVPGENTVHKLTIRHSRGGRKEARHITNHRPAPDYRCRPVKHVGERWGVVNAWRVAGERCRCTGRPPRQLQ